MTPPPWSPPGQLPALIAAAGELAQTRFVELFTALTRNPNGRRTIRRRCGNSQALSPLKSRPISLKRDTMSKMTRADIIAKLKSIEPELRARGVAALYLFGSYARDEALPDSDVDVFIDPADANAFGLVPLFESQVIVARTLPGAELSYSTRDAIEPCYRPAIERDAIRIF